MRVNFIAEFNAIWRYCNNNGISGRERLLWLALFKIANDRAELDATGKERDFPDDYFAVSNAEMTLNSTLDKRGIEGVRNALKQRGVIDFIPGFKNTRMPKYKINYQSVGYKNAPNNDANIVPNDVPNIVPSFSPTMHPDMSPYTKIKEYPKEEDKVFEKSIGLTENWRTGERARKGVCRVLTEKICAENPKMEVAGLFDVVWRGLDDTGIPPKDIMQLAYESDDVFKFSVSMTMPRQGIRKGVVKEAE